MFSVELMLTVFLLILLSRLSWVRRVYLLAFEAAAEEGPAGLGVLGDEDIFVEHHLFLVLDLLGRQDGLAVDFLHHAALRGEVQVVVGFVLVVDQDVAGVGVRADELLSEVGELLVVLAAARLRGVAGLEERPVLDGRAVVVFEQALPRLGVASVLIFVHRIYDMPEMF
jgi:hypothetical protein